MPDVRRWHFALLEADKAVQTDAGHYEGILGGYTEVHHAHLKDMALYALAGHRLLAAKPARIREAFLDAVLKEHEDWLAAFPGDAVLSGGIRETTP